MLLPFLMFAIGVLAVLAAYAAVTLLPGYFERRRLDRRLRDVSVTMDLTDRSDATVIKETNEGPLPAIDRLMEKTGAGSTLGRVIQQSGVRITPSGLVLLVIGAALGAGLLTAMFVRLRYAPVVAAVIGGLVPIAWIAQRRSRRMKQFEEMFPEALDLLSRAIRAGHAFQTALGMVADELGAPVGPEFKIAFDQQNFGLPLRDSLAQLAERMPLLDVRFFVTAVLIQRDTGGNLSEILDNLAHVVRERFKILRQVRVHTAHGRFTGWVLMGLPATLAVVLSFINPDHMNLLFHERMGQTMLVVAVVMEAVGYVWIRQVIKIEV